MGDLRGLLINGASGVGKSTCLQQVAALLGERGEQWAVVDLDYLTLSGPRPDDDPYGLEVALANLTDVARNYRRSGVERLAVSHVFSERSHVARARAAIGDDTAPVIRLRARRDTVISRLRARHALESPHELDGFLRGHAALEAALSDAALDDAIIDVDDLTPAETAVRVAEAAGWLDGERG